MSVKLYYIRLALESWGVANCTGSTVLETETWPDRYISTWGNWVIKIIQPLSPIDINSQASSQPLCIIMLVWVLARGLYYQHSVYGRSGNLGWGADYYCVPMMLSNCLCSVYTCSDDHWTYYIYSLSLAGIILTTCLLHIVYPCKYSICALSTANRLLLLFISHWLL